MDVNDQNCKITVLVVVIVYAKMIAEQTRCLTIIALRKPPHKMPICHWRLHHLLPVKILHAHVCFSAMLACVCIAHTRQLPNSKQNMVPAYHQPEWRLKLSGLAVAAYNWG